MREERVREEVCLNLRASIYRKTSRRGKESQLESHREEKKKKQETDERNGPSKKVAAYHRSPNNGYKPGPSSKQRVPGVTSQKENKQ